MPLTVWPSGSIGFVFCPSTALYRPFLMFQSNVTWPSSALLPELAYSWAQCNVLWRVSLNIFLMLFLSPMLFMYLIFIASPLWLFVLGLYKEEYLQNLNVCPLHLNFCCGERECWPRKPINKTSLMMAYIFCCLQNLTYVSIESFKSFHLKCNLYHELKKIFWTFNKINSWKQKNLVQFVKWTNML